MKSTSSTFRKRSDAFTLIELLVVIGIIAILAAIMIPAVKTLSRGNSQKQAVNLLTAMIASAHANALQSHTFAGLVIYDDPAAPNQSSIQLVTAQSVSLIGAPPPITFVRTPRTQAQALPIGVAVATLDDSAQLFNDTTFTPNTCRCILFDPNGQLVLRGGLTLDSSLTSPPDAAAAKWNFGNGLIPPGASSPGFIIYDQSLLNAGKNNNTITSANFGTWMEQNGDVIVINPYTGNIIR